MDGEGRRREEFLLEFEVRNVQPEHAFCIHDQGKLSMNCFYPTRQVLSEEIAEEERAVEIHAAFRSLMLHLQNAPYSTAPASLVGWCLEALHRGPDLEGSWMEVDNDAPSRVAEDHPCEVLALRSVNVQGVLRVQLLLRRHH